MEDIIKEVGLWENLMDMEFLHGLMVRNIKEITNTDKNMVKEHLLGLMVKSIKEDGNKENNMERDKFILEEHLQRQFGDRE